jgi:hypothetical protein
VTEGGCGIDAGERLRTIQSIGSQRADEDKNEANHLKIEDNSVVFQSFD